MTWSPREPYNALPHLPPAVDLESKPVLKAAIEARAALASLNEATQSIPNPTVLLNTLPLLEAQASSEIENIVTTTDEMFKYAQDETAAASPATREALRYRTALYRGFLSLRERPLSTNTALEVCSIIKLHEMHVRDKPGTFIGNPVTHEAIYTPPVGRDLILKKLRNWERFLHDDSDVDPLIKMAVANYQFEAIHPFEDGNGRTGRVINILLLVSAGLVAQPILYLSRYVIENKSEYYARLQAVTSEADWENWILYTLEGIRQTSIFTMRKVAGIRELQHSMQEELRSTQPAGANADLLAVLFEQPYCRIRDVRKRCGVSRPTASKWLNALVDHGVLSSVKVGRERLYVNEQFVRLLTRDEVVAPSRTATPRLF